MKNYKCKNPREIWVNVNGNEYREVLSKEGGKINYRIYFFAEGEIKWEYDYTGINEESFYRDVHDYGDTRCTSIPIE